jgi:Holliday junction resolvase RusA-like endonuclease
MPRRLAFLVPGRPITWKRPKVHGGGYTKSAAATAHYRTLRKAFRDEAMAQGVRAFSGPVAVRLHFHFEGRSGFTGIEVLPFAFPWLLPKSKLWTGVNSVAAELQPNADRIDIDNLEKIVLEAAANSGVLHDDAQVAYVEKWKTGSARKRKK